MIKIDDEKWKWKTMAIHAINEKLTKTEGVCWSTNNVGVKGLNNVKKQKQERNQWKTKKKSIETKSVRKEQQVNAICEFQGNAKIEGVCWRCHF